MDKQVRYNELVTKAGYALEYEESITVAKYNASMREWNGRYRDDQRGGLPGSSAEKGRRVGVDIVEHRGNISLGVYRREEGNKL